MNRILVVGASLAGLRAAETLRREGFDGELTILGAEDHLPYDRPPLSKELLAGESDAHDVALRVDDDLEADWVLGDAAAALDLHARSVRTASGRELAFDGLVIATGSRPRRLPGLEPRPGVLELRTLEDALALRAALAGGPRLVLVGCGFIGVEVASTARALGAEVDIVSLDPPLVLAGELISGVCGQMLHEAGVRMHPGRTVARIAGDDAGVRAVHLDDGTILEADVVVSAIGAEPVTDWLEGSGLELDRGVSCDASCAALGADDVVAAGDVARWPNPRFGGLSLRIEHWTNAVEQGMAAARTLLHGSGPATAYASVPSFWSDHCGTRLQSVGLPLLADRVEVVDGSVAERKFVTAAYRGERLVGASTYGMVRGLARYRAALARTEETRSGAAS